MKLTIKMLGQTMISTGLTEAQVLDAIAALPTGIGIKQEDIKIELETGDK